MNEGLERLRIVVSQLTKYRVETVPLGTEGITFASPARLVPDRIAKEWLIRVLDELLAQDASEAEAHELGHLLALYQTGIIQVLGYESDEGARVAMKIGNVVQHIYLVPKLNADFGIQNKSHVDRLLEAVELKSEGGEILVDGVSPQWMLQIHGLTYYELVKLQHLTEEQAIEKASWSIDVKASLQAAIAELGAVKEGVEGNVQLSAIQRYIVEIGYKPFEVERVDDDCRALTSSATH